MSRRLDTWRETFNGILDILTTGRALDGAEISVEEASARVARTARRLDGRAVPCAHARGAATTAIDPREQLHYAS